MGVTREQVVWGYRLFLTREPESDEVISEKISACNSLADLRRAFASSMEFQNSVTTLSPFDSTNVVIKEIGNGVRLFVDLADTLIGVRIVEGKFELAEREFILRTLQPGDVTIDVGANVGYFALLMASKVGPEGHVYAFEPLPRNSALLAQSVTENGFADRITLTRAALADRGGELELVSPTTSLHWGGAYLRTADEDAFPSGHEVTRVQVSALDEMALRRPVKFIKIDAEGAELLILRGASRLLHEDRPVVLAEISAPQLGLVSRGSPTDMITFMARHGYRCRPVSGPEEIATYTSDAIINVIFEPQDEIEAQHQ